MEKKTFMQKLKNMGPAAIITSAFIGPGTITTVSYTHLLAETRMAYCAWVKLRRTLTRRGIGSPTPILSTWCRVSDRSP